VNFSPLPQIRLTKGQYFLLFKKEGQKSDPP
jgi:hypothetical protein